VPVTLEVWDGMVHGWHQFADFLPEGREAIERIARFVHECVAERATR
jgi:acetyl esterase/lipase